MTSYLVEHAAQLRAGPFISQLIAAAREVCATRAGHFTIPHLSLQPLTPAELGVLKLLPAGSYQQMAGAFYVSRNTLKTHLRSVYRKLGVASRSEALERAVGLGLL